MATGRKTVAPGQVVASDWGNTVWDQSVQQFDSAAVRDTQFPAPLDGAMCYLADIKQIQVRVSGAWKVAGSDVTILGTPIAGVAYNPAIHRPHSFLFDASVTTNQYGQINVPVTNAGFLGYHSAVTMFNNRVWIPNIDFANTPSLTALLIIAYQPAGGAATNLSVDASVIVSGWK